MADQIPEDKKCCLSPQARPQGSHVRDPTPAQPRHTCRLSAIPCEAETGPNPLCPPHHPGFTKILLPPIHKPAPHVWFWFLFFFFLNSSPHFTPASPAWRLRPSWQKLEELRRENTWQTGLSFSHQTNQAQCNSHLAGNTPKEQHKQKQACKQQEASKIEERDLALLSRGSFNLLQGQIPHELIIKRTERGIEEAPTPDKEVSAQATLTLGSVWPLVPSSLPSPNFLSVYTSLLPSSDPFHVTGALCFRK